MSLRYDFTACENDHLLSDVEREALVYNTMTIGISKITKENVREVFARTAFAEKVLGSWIKDVKENEVVPRYLTREVIENAVGLSTNASTLTPTQFQKNVWKIHDQSIR